MKLYRTASGPIVVHESGAYQVGDSWDETINRDDLADHLKRIIATAPAIWFDESHILSPIVSQEVWAAGVTYFRSRDARMEESQSAGGGNFYDRVYNAPRPELFFKSTAQRVVGHNQPVRIRRDSKWNVPEPELTLVITSSGKIIGYTIGNDMSSRDIEGENPLYLPQAKSYDASCALGPGILVTGEMLPRAARIELSILRDGTPCFTGETTLAELKRDPRELVEYLYRETTFASGCFLMTGTGIIPPSDFTLAVGDIISISIDGIGTLTNPVAIKSA